MGMWEVVGKGSRNGNIPGAAAERLPVGMRPLSTRTWLRDDDSNKATSPRWTGLAMASAAKSAKRPTHERSILAKLGAMLAVASVVEIASVVETG